MIELRPSMKSRATGNALRYATCWAVVRTDGVTIRVTDHNSDLDVLQGSNTYTYRAAAGFNTSAREREANFKDRNAELVGYLSSDFITEEDLRAGRYNDATVYELVVDWYCPWAGILTQTPYSISEVSFTGEVWQAQVVGLTQRISKPRGDIYTRLCRWDLFSNFGNTLPGCKLDPTIFTKSGMVTEVTTQRRSFKTDLTSPDRYHSRGVLTWASGLNAGIRCEVQTYKHTDGKFVLYLNTPFDIAADDALLVTAGCAKDPATCLGTFNNLQNYGGFPFIPGNDRMLQIPVTR